MRVKVKATAANDWWFSIIPRDCPRWEPTREQWQYKYALEAIQGTEVTLVGPVDRGVAGCVYALLPEDYKAARSHVIALPLDLLVPVADEPVYAELQLDRPPVEDRGTSGAGAWWKKDRLDVVRLLTPWTDRFMAFTPYRNANRD